jgi:hypothetical protein
VSPEAKALHARVQQFFLDEVVGAEGALDANFNAHKDVKPVHDDAGEITGYETGDITVTMTLVFDGRTK